ncbi:MAG: T9SS type A sorting domain-containing protein [Lentimicrobium sp.]|nr:T9SS type A sorting domain-containing protein [Lentimicrobium sp.]
MRKNLLLLLLAILFATPGLYAQKPKKQMYMPNAPVPGKYKVDPRIDNMSYWRRMASLGLVPVAPDYPAPLGKYNGSKLIGKNIMTEDSPDVPVTTVNSTQSENSVFVNPNAPTSLLNSNNSTPNPVAGIYGANDFMSEDSGTTWGGEVQGAGGENSGDPATAIGLNGWYYVGYIHSSGGQGVSYSTDQGNTWTPVLVAPSPGGFSSLLDKNHMWIDNSPTSPYEGNLYDAWTNFGGDNDADIEISRSTNQGLAWSSAVNISSAVNAGSHNQGVNLQTGPNGEVYAIWAIYDGFPQDEKAIGMARSLDGGATWLPSERIINNIRGIRSTTTSKNMRVNGFPTMAVDISNGSNSGAIYVAWTNIGTPGINTGNDMDIYVAKSTDQGVSWGTPVRVNQDPAGLGKQHFFPWITCDATNGNLSVIYYDDRNVSSTQCEVYVSNSIDGGETWEDIKVSDVSFTPQPISGLADDYFGDYLAIHSHGRWVYPIWTDNRTGSAMTYVSAFQSGPPPNQPWLVYQSHSVSDEAGNNNGLLDFGETVKFNITIENIGDQPSSAVMTTLSTESTYIEITDATASFGDFEVAEIKAFEQVFELNVTQNIPDGEIITFTLTSIDAADSTFVNNFNVEAHAPALQAGSLVINDAAGNNNGRLDPGETVTVSILTSNPGDYIAHEVTGLLSAASPFISISNSQVVIGDLAPGMLNAITTEFELTVDPLTPIGYSTILNYTLTSTLISQIKSYNVQVGLIVEDWETGGESFDWQFPGLAPWTITTDQAYEGNSSVVSGTIGNSQSTEMTVPYEVMSNDTISFYLKVSSEEDYDYLKFYVDNTLRGQWSGEVNWQLAKYAVDAGEHTFKWTYSKDVGVVGGSDKAWVDFIIFPAPVQIISFAGMDDSICGMNAYLLDGVAANYESTLWTSSGDGTFEDASALSTFYTPGMTDLETGNVELTLTALGADDNSMTDSMTLTIGKQASAIAGNPASICEGEEFQLEGAGENYLSISWSSSGDGNFSDATILNPVYTPGEQDLLSGTVQLMITATSSAPCVDVSSELTLTILPRATAAISGDTSICIGASVPVMINLTGTAPWNLEVEGYGPITATENPVEFIVTPTETQTYQLLSVVDANGCDGIVEGSYTVTVNALPVVSLVSDTSGCYNHVITLVAETEGAVNYLWTPGNYTSQSINVDTTGFGGGTHSWTVVVTDENNCTSSATSTVNFYDCTGIDEPGINAAEIYPNPSNGAFTIRFAKATSKTVNLTIADAAGNEVYQLNNATPGNKELKVRVPGLAAGIYMVKITDDNKISSLRLIIK